jgi:hypothetical protein
MVGRCGRSADEPFADIPEQRLKLFIMPDPRTHPGELAHRAVHHQGHLRIVRVAAQRPGLFQRSERSAVIARAVVAEAQIGVDRRIPVGLRVRCDEGKQGLGVIGEVASDLGLVFPSGVAAANRNPDV